MTDYPADGRDISAPIKVSDGPLRGFFIVDNDIFSRSRKLSAHAILIYCVLCRLSEGTNETTANRGYIAKFARVSLGTVSKATAELKRAGLVAITAGRKGQKNLPSIYTLNSTSRPSKLKVRV
jgi:Helix-turn-helix domain